MDTVFICTSFKNIDFVYDTIKMFVNEHDIY